jgi:signal peptidase
MSKMLKIISNTLALVAVLFVFLLHGLRLFGLTPYCVLSGSMQSVYPTGSLIYVTDVLPEKLDVGDIITFRLSGGTVVTHRIVECVPDENDAEIIRFRTKGDENAIADGTLVECGDVIGKPLFCVPLLGYLVSYLSTKAGRCAICAGMAVLLLAELTFHIVLNVARKRQRK